LEIQSRILFGDKFSAFIYLDLFLWLVSAVLFGFLDNMAKFSQSTVNTINIHQLKIDIVKFNSMNNFGMWRCKVMDVLNASNLKDSLLHEKTPEEIFEKYWDKMKWMTCGIIRSCLHMIWSIIDDQCSKKWF